MTHTQITITPAGHGHYIVTSMAWGKAHSVKTNDMELIDLYKSKCRGWKTAEKQLRDKVLFDYKTKHK
jgi:hypothetical protein